MKVISLVGLLSVLVYGQSLSNLKYFNTYANTEEDYSSIFVHILDDDKTEYFLMARRTIREQIYEEYYSGVIKDFGSFLYLLWSGQISIPSRYLKKTLIEGYIRKNYIYKYKNMSIADIISRFTRKGYVENTYILDGKMPDDQQCELLFYFMKNCYLIFWNDAGACWVLADYNQTNFRKK